ncbi:hypothetical protein [Sphingomonas sp.]|uniref:hypothetical protein n=1 Tax=Sphingomonas sp. TaxID=28214 RepID=UPI0035C813AB
MTFYHHARGYVAITAAAITVPPSGDGRHPPGQHLVGIGMFLAERGGKRRWRFARRSQAIPAGTPESVLLDWAAQRLPDDATPIGWNVDHGLVPLLLDAAAGAPAAVACTFVRSLHGLLGRGVVDMSLWHGGAGAPPLTRVAADMAIHAPARKADALMGAWSIGNVDQLRRDLADEAMAIWRVFVRTAGLTGLDAEAATDAWVLRRQRMNAVARTGEAR